MLPLVVALGIWLWLTSPPPVSKGAVLRLRLSGDIRESAPPGQLSTFDIWRLLNTAAADQRIVELQLAPESPSAGWAKLAEIRGAIAAFKRSGKRVTAFLRTANSKDYYLATAADRIAMQPGD